MEDALLSAESFSVLSGAGLIDATDEKPIYVHQTSQVKIKTANTIEIPDIACWNKTITNVASSNHEKDSADIFVMVLNKNYEIDTEPCIPESVTHNENGTSTIICNNHDKGIPEDAVVLVDYYVLRTKGAQVMEITADKFAGNYYLEASTLFRNTAGVDMPAEFIIPNCKIQSNFTFSMAATGDPSTFTFTMDAFPDYTKFDSTKKVMAVIQVIEDEDEDEDDTRLPCGMIHATEGSLKIVSEGNKITVSGKSAGNVYNEDLFGTDHDAVKGAEITLDMPIGAQGGTYTVVQTNPALEMFYPADSRISASGDTYVKTATYTIPAGEKFEYSLLLGEEAGAVTVVLKGSDGEVIKTFNIVNDVTFAA